MNCMTKVQEERFYYLETVSALKQFLLEKKRRLIKRLEKKEHSEETKKAQKYLSLLEAVLTSSYFFEEFKYQKVYQLMQRLKEDDRLLKKEIEDLKKKLGDMELYLATTDEFSIPEDYAISDERKDLEDVLNAKRKEYERKITLIREEMREKQINLSICRNLKGMICRPHGFFDAVLH